MMNSPFSSFQKNALAITYSVYIKTVVLLILAILSGNNSYSQANSISDSPSVTKTSVANGNWSLATNWSPTGVPSTSDDVVINNNILVDLSSASCSNLIINSGGKLGLNADFSISGNFTNNGTLVHNSGLINFNGTAIQYILGSSTSVFYNVAINNAAGVCINSAALTTINNNLTINAGKKLLINPDKFLTVTGTISNNYGGSNGGVEGLVLKSNADGTGSLIHNTDNVPATIERFILGDVTQTAKRYHQVSLPFNSSANPVSGLFEGSYLFRFEESAGSTGDWVGYGSATSTPLNVNSGYLIYYVQPSGSMVYNFEGQMRNGAIRFPGPAGSLPFTDIAHGYSLVPNPYPSAIDWRAASGWTKTQINNAIYIWNPDKNQYASYVSGAGNNGGSRYIAQGQSFFIHARKATASLTVNNNARIHLSQSTQPFFKSEQEENLNTLKLEARVLLETDETVIRFVGDATEQFDSELDAMKFLGGTDAPQLSSVSSDSIKLSINSLSINAGNRIVPLEFTYTKSAEITFTVSGIENFVLSLPIYLEDILLNKNIDLRQQPVYKFNHVPGQKNRFRLRFENTNGKVETEADKVFVYFSHGKVNIDIPGKPGKNATIQFFDVAGRLLSASSTTLNGVVQVDAPATTGIYIVRILAGNEVYTRRVVVN